MPGQGQGTLPTCEEEQRGPRDRRSVPKKSSHCGTGEGLDCLCKRVCISTQGELQPLI